MKFYAQVRTDPQINVSFLDHIFLPDPATSPHPASEHFQVLKPFADPDDVGNLSRHVSLRFVLI